MLGNVSTLLFGDVMPEQVHSCVLLGISAVQSAVSLHTELPLVKGNRIAISSQLSFKRLVHLLHFKLQKNSVLPDSCQKQGALGKMSHCN